MMLPTGKTHVGRQSPVRILVGYGLEARKRYLAHDVVRVVAVDGRSGGKAHYRSLRTRSSNVALSVKQTVAMMVMTETVDMVGHVVVSSRLPLAHVPLAGAHQHLNDERKCSRAMGGAVLSLE